MKAFALACASALALAALFVAELTREAGTPDAAEALVYILVLAALCGFGLGALRAVLGAMERPLGPRTAPFASALVLLALTGTPLWSLARDFASGPRVQELLGGMATPLIFTASACLVAGLWLWNRLVLPLRDVPAGRRGRALGVAGLLVAAPLGWVIHAELRAYAPLMDLGLAVFAVLAASLPALALASIPRRLGRVFAAVLGLSGAVAGLWLLLAPGVLDDARAQVVPVSPLAARVDRHVFAPVRAASLLRDPSTVVCPTVPQPAPTTPHARNVLLLSADTLRADAMGWEIDDAPLAPNLRRFAEASIAVPAAVSPYPATVFAMSSAFTGLSPSRLLFAPRATPTVVSRAAALVDEAAAFLPTSPWFAKPAVETLIVGALPSRPYSNASAAVSALVSTLQATRAEGETYVFWAHFLEPHEPYERHAAYDFGTTERARYMGEVAYLDAQLGRLFEYLERSGAYEDTLVVFFSDHGEALGERGYSGHHVYLDDFITDVPLYVRAPGQPPRVVEGTVALADIAATLADYVGLPQTPGSEGLSLLSRDPPKERGVVSEAFPVRGHELFALANDPIESVAELDARMHRVHESATRYAPKVAIVAEGHRLIVDRDSGLRELSRRDGSRVEDPHRLARMAASLARWHRETSTAIYCALE